jgi:hypothetical protein
VQTIVQNSGGSAMVSSHQLLLLHKLLSTTREHLIHKSEKGDANDDEFIVDQFHTSSLFPEDLPVVS